MSDMEFRAAKDAQDTVIRRDLALLRGDPKRRRHHRRLEIVCPRNNHALVEVLTTSTWGAVCFRAAMPDPARSELRTVDERIEELRAGGRRDEIRAGDGVFFPIALPVTSAEQIGTFIDALCPCGRHHISGDLIATALRRGVRKVRLGTDTL